MNSSATLISVDNDPAVLHIEKKGHRAGKTAQKQNRSADISTSLGHGSYYWGKTPCRLTLSGIKGADAYARVDLSK
jgi:hypothetical protein